MARKNIRPNSKGYKKRWDGKSSANDHREPAGGWIVGVGGRLGLIDRADGRLGLQRALTGGVLEQLVRPRRVLGQTTPALGVVHAQVVARLHVAQTGRLFVILGSLKHKISEVRKM